MAAPDAVAVTLYERPGCHLCEEAAVALAPLVERLGARLERVNVEADEAFESRYGLVIPAVAVDGVDVTDAPIDLEAVAKAIAAARARASRPRTN